jgi:hypothetical protein
MAARLFKALGIESSEVCHPEYFWLDSTTPSAHWYKILPDGLEIKFRTRIRILSTIEITLCSNYPWTLSEPAKPLVNKVTTILKSQLQKVIRRSNTYRAVKTAAYYAQLDPVGFLRRLAIIAVEDALPLPGYEVLCFLIAVTSKGASLPDEMYAWCMHYVYQLAKCNYREEIYRHNPPLPVARGKFTRLADGDRDIPYSILLRESYGGTSGDMSLCRSAAILWSLRYNTKSVLLEHLTCPSGFITGGRDMIFEKGDWYLPAIDFHCCPDILPYVKEKHDVYSLEQIKSAIWKHNSSITNKKILTEDTVESPDTEVWNEIKKTVISYQMFKIDKL